MSLKEAIFSVVESGHFFKSGNMPSAGIVAAAVIALGSRPQATAAASTVRRLMKTDSGVISEGLIPASNLLLILLTDWLSLSNGPRQDAKVLGARATAPSPTLRPRA